MKCTLTTSVLTTKLSKPQLFRTPVLSMAFVVIVFPLMLYGFKTTNFRRSKPHKQSWRRPSSLLTSTSCSGASEEMEELGKSFYKNKKKSTLYNYLSTHTQHSEIWKREMMLNMQQLQKDVDEMKKEMKMLDQPREGSSLTLSPLSPYIYAKSKFTF